MSPIREDLLVEENLTFIPLSGTFDVEAVSDFVAGIGCAYRDEFVPSAFALFTSPEYREECAAARRADPTSSYPYVPIIMIQPNEIVFYPVAKQEDLRQLSIEFLNWILENYKCRIENDFGTDVTEPPPTEETEDGVGQVSDA